MGEPNTVVLDAGSSNHIISIPTGNLITVQSGIDFAIHAKRNVDERSTEIIIVSLGPQGRAENDRDLASPTTSLKWS
jgi:hypothetical protein